MTNGAPKAPKVLPIDPVIGLGGGMPGNENERLIGLARSGWNTGVSQAAKAGGNARHDAEPHAGVGQGPGLLAAAAEDEGIATLKPQYTKILPGELNETFGNIVLAMRRAPAAFAGNSRRAAGAARAMTRSETRAS